MDSSPQLQHVLKNMAESDPTKLPTPSACLAGEFQSDFHEPCIEYADIRWECRDFKERKTKRYPNISFHCPNRHTIELITYIYETQQTDFCLIPIGTPSASVSSEVAAVQRLLKKSKVSYTMHSAGTTLGA